MYWNRKCINNHHIQQGAGEPRDSMEAFTLQIKPLKENSKVLFSSIEKGLKIEPRGEQHLFLVVSIVIHTNFQLVFLILRVVRKWYLVMQIQF